MSGTARRMGGTRETQVISLLNELGDRIIRSEKERFTVRAEIAETKDLLSSLEDRAEQTERIFLTIQDKITKQDSLEARILKRQDDLERLQKDNAERLSRAEELALKIEEAIVLQNRLARRLERTAQDKVLILSKIERIEASVEQTREALSSTALAMTPVAVPPPGNENWLGGKSLRAQMGVLASILIAGVLGGVAITQLMLHWPQSIQPGTPSPVQVVESTASSVPSPAHDASSEIMDNQEADRAMDKDPDAVAAALNQIEPGAVSGPPTEAIAAPVSGDEKESGAGPAEPAIETASLSPADLESPPPADAEKIEEKGGEVSVEPSSGMPQKQEIDPALDEFIHASVDSSRLLTQRILPDPKLPPVVRQIEMKALAGVPEAQHDLAAIYTAGHGGVEVDYARAVLWFQEAAVNGIANARYNLGVLYHQGLGVEKDVVKAIKWYRAAAALGHPEAEYNLGIAYIEGIGTQYDPRKAADYFEQAARGGVMEAAYNLGLIHENGLLGKADMEEAVFWYKMASEYNPESKVAYGQLVKTMSLDPEDVEAIVKKFNAVYGLNGDMKQPRKAAEEAADEKPVKMASVDAGRINALRDPVDLSSIPPLSSQDSKALMNAVSPDQALVAQIQEQLARLGLYPGPADGVGGPQTEDAIRSYQKKSNMTVTGHPSEELLVHMLTSELNAVAGALNDEMPGRETR